MARDLDGFAVFRSIAGHENAFGSIRIESKKIARTLVLKQLKAKDSSVKALRDVWRALGRECFDLIVDGMSDPELKSLISKFDKHHPDVKTATSDWRRKHIRRLAAAEAEPLIKQKPASKAKGKAKSASVERLFSEAMAAVRNRK